MKSFLLLAIITIIYSCNGQEVIYPKYEYGVDYYRPDSMASQQRTWIVDALRATHSHLSAGDYEDPEDVVYALANQSDNLFQVRGEGLRKIKYEDESYPEFIPLERLTENEKQIYNSLRPKTDKR